MAQLFAAAPGHHSDRRALGDRVAILFALAFGLLAIGALLNGILDGWVAWVRS